MKKLDPSLMVTGATGQTINCFFDRLRKEKFDKKIICLLRSSSNLNNIDSRELDVDFRFCDFNSVNSLKNAMHGIKTVLHAAHISLSEKIIEAGNLVGVEWFICVHTTGRFSRFRNSSQEYIRIENNILRDHKNVTILRPTLIYGNKLDRNMWKLISKLHRSKFFPIFGNGENLFQPVNSIDLGNAYYDVIDHKNNTFGKEYNLSGRDILSYNSILNLITERLNNKVFFVKVPNLICVLIVYVLNKLPKKIYRCPVKVEQVLRMREDKIFSYKDASIDFNYSPISFKDGINLEIDNYIDSLKI